MLKTLRYRLAHLQGKNELIARAIGWKPGVSLHIFDVTAGLAKESLILAALGCQVTLFERHSAVLPLLKETLEKIKIDPFFSGLLSRMQLIETCAIEYLTSSVASKPEVIYCDPMFEKRKKSAAVKKDMQNLQTIVGKDEDAPQLVEIAMRNATHRVVVKRPRLALPLYPKPSFNLIARSHRFDIYTINQ